MRSGFKLLIAVTATGMLFGGALPIHASCAPPMVSIDAFQAKPGDTVRVTGEAWMSGCDDTDGSEAGCGSSDDSTEPLTGIQLRLKGPRTDQTKQQLNVGAIGDTEIDISLGTVGADDQGEFTKLVTMPEVPPGTYFLTAISELPAYQPPQIVIIRS